MVVVASTVVVVAGAVVVVPSVVVVELEVVEASVVDESDVSPPHAAATSARAISKVNRYMAIKLTRSGLGSPRGPRRHGNRRH